MNFFIEIDTNSTLPLYKKVANALKESIDSGRLQEGNAVPSTRQLSVHLGVSRITVVQSYEQLISQGYLKVVTGTGTFVSRSRNSKITTNNVEQSKQTTTKELSGYGNRLLVMHNQNESALPETEFGLPPAALLPLKQWLKLLVKHSSANSQLHRAQGALDSLGCLPLREAIANYLGRSRNINCSADSIAIFASAQHSVSLILHLLLDPGDAVAVENPGFICARKTISSIGAEPIAINIDSDGLIVQDLVSTAQKRAIRAAYVTPNRQDPLGVSLSLNRRHELLNWARESSSYIIEDDYDCEYSYVFGQSSQALQSLDKDESVIYLSSFWKLLYPIMPIGFLVAPPHLIPALTQAKQLNEHAFSLPEQMALAEFINEGLLERHIGKTQKQLAKSRQELILALTITFGQTIAIAKHSSGMHIVVQFNQANEEVISLAAKQAGLSLISTKSYYLTGKKQGEFLISFANHLNHDIAEQVAIFGAVINNYSI
ncbi:PLP-dependent aminotransferase family protein [soil metagenome]